MMTPEDRKKARAKGEVTHRANVEAREKEEFRKAVDRLNALMGQWECWKPTHARKDHVDDLGRPIKENELYFRQENPGGGWGNESKLSRKSMKQLARLVLTHFNIELADRLIKQEQERLGRAAASILHFKGAPHPRMQLIKPAP